MSADFSIEVVHGLIAQSQMYFIPKVLAHEASKIKRLKFPLRVVKLLNWSGNSFPGSVITNKSTEFLNKIELTGVSSRH